MTILTGLIGSGIARSGSPAIHQEEAHSLGLDLQYRLFDLAADPVPAVDLEPLLRELEAQKYAGVNVTAPFKQQIVSHLQALSDDARRVGAVNTVRFEQGRRVGFNTDWSGFAAALQRDFPGADLSCVLQLGAGGAGAACAYALLHLGCPTLFITDPNAARARGLVRRLREHFAQAHVEAAPMPASVMARVVGLVQASSIGMQSHPGSPLPIELLRPDLWVSEVIYFPQQTVLLQAAQALGCRVANGNAMAVFQAAKAFELLTGQTPDIERMLHAFSARLRG